MSLLWRLAANTAAVWLTVWLVPGLTYEGDFWGLVLLGLVIGLVNSLIKPIVRLLTLPIRWLTLGLFSLVVNVLMMVLVIVISESLDLGLTSDDFATTLLGALILSVVAWLLSLFVSD